MNENIIQVIALLEEPVKEAFKWAAREAFGEEAESGVKSILDDLVSNNLYDNKGTFVSKFIQTFLQIFSDKEKTSTQIEIEEVVSAIIREPFLTGLEQLRVANKMVAFSKQSAQYRTRRFRNALNSFDRARSLASEAFEIALIDLLRGLCAFELPGGTPEALVHLMAFQVWAQKEGGYLASVREDKRRKVERLNVEIEDLKCSLQFKSGNGPLTLALLSAQIRVQYLQKEINDITLLEAKIFDITFHITALLEIAQKIINKKIKSRHS